MAAEAVVDGIIGAHSGEEPRGELRARGAGPFQVRAREGGKERSVRETGFPDACHAVFDGAPVPGESGLILQFQDEIASPFPDELKNFAEFWHGSSAVRFGFLP